MIISSQFQGKMNPFHSMLHPFEGFYTIKEERKGSVVTAAIIIAVFFVSELIKRQNMGYIFNEADLTALNIGLIATKTVVLYALWVTCNWAVATWMDGEGTAVEISIISAYSLLHYVITTIVTTLLSNVLVKEEGSFLYYFAIIAFLWSCVLMVIGMQTVHDYGFVKTLQSLLLTIVAMGIVIFLSVLFFTLFQQLILFFYTIYNELLFRL